MNIENQIAELFKQLKDFPFDVKQWIVRVIGFAVTTDRIIQPNEIPSLLALIQAVRDIPEMTPVLQDILKSTKPPMDVEFSIPGEVAEKIFECVLDICASDRTIQSEEYEYINELGIILELSTSRIHELVNVVVRGHIKASFFKQLLHNLDKKGRYWVSVMILKVIHADEQIDQWETHYLKDVYELLKKDSISIEAVKKDALEKPFDQLANIEFDQETAICILTYLLEILLSGKEIDKRELATIQNISNLLGIGTDDFNSILKNLKAEVLTPIS